MRAPRLLPRCMAFAGMLCGLAAATAQAHRASDAYLTMVVQDATVEGRWDIAIRDLDHVLGLDRDGDDAITWGELQEAQGAVVDFALQHLGVRAGAQPCQLSPQDFLVAEHADGPYAVLRFEAACTSRIVDLALRYSLFAEADPLHRGLLRLDWAGRTTTYVFGPENPQFAARADTASGFDGFKAFLGDGVRHIVLGIDHILFLLTLLLAALVRREGRSWRVVKGLRRPLLGILRTVTAFTVAHSLTLSLAAFGLVHLPMRLTDGLVALSILVGGLNNLRPLLTSRLVLLVFAFGLVHGLGFASALTGLALPRADMIWAVLAFNLGVEAGQFIIIAAVVPFAYAFWFFFRFEAVLARFVSASIAALGAVWLVERALGVWALGL